jgi:hypothetical protein
VGLWGVQSSPGPDRGRSCSPGVVPTVPFRMGSIHKSVDGSLNPRKIIFLLNITSHFVLSNVTLHPALQRGLMLMSEAIVNDGTICPVSVVGRPRMFISHTCVDWILLPYGKSIVMGDTAMHLLSTAAPSMMNMDITPVSPIAWCIAIGRALINFGLGFLAVQLEAITVAVSSSLYDDLFIWVGSKELLVAESK